MRHREPIFNAPAVVVVLLAILVLIHIARMLLPAAIDEQVQWIAAVVPARFGDLHWQVPGGRIPLATSLVTHMLLHGDIIHLLINCAWLLVFGTIVARRVGTTRFLALAVASGIAGAGLFCLVNIGLMQPLIGCSGAVSGLMGATLRLMMPAMAHGGLAVLRDRPELVQVPPLLQALSDRRMLLWIGLVVVLNLLSVVGFGGGAESGTIAWEAHLGGFFVGIVAFGLFDRKKPPAVPPVGFAGDDDVPPLRPTLH